MRSTGIVRQTDLLNRIVIPKELCNERGIAKGTPLEIFTDGESIVLKKYQPGCVFCDSLDNLKSFNGKPVCEKCRREIK